MVKTIQDMFIRFDRIHERGRQTDGRTDRRIDGHRALSFATHMQSIARQKLSASKTKRWSKSERHNKRNRFTRRSKDSQKIEGDWRILLMENLP